MTKPSVGTMTSNGTLESEPAMEKESLGDRIKQILHARSIEKVEWDPLIGWVNSHVPLARVCRDYPEDPNWLRDMLPKMNSFRSAELIVGRDGKCFWAAQFFVPYGNFLLLFHAGKTRWVTLNYMGLALRHEKGAARKKETQDLCAQFAREFAEDFRKLL